MRERRSGSREIAPPANPRISSARGKRQHVRQMGLWREAAKLVLLVLALAALLASFVLRERSAKRPGLVGNADGSVTLLYADRTESISLSPRPELCERHVDDAERHAACMARHSARFDHANRACGGATLAVLRCLSPASAAALRDPPGADQARCKQERAAEGGCRAMEMRAMDKAQPPQAAGAG